ncbi:MAG: zinc ribbon domain-containing protein [Aquificaceae bacterium]
MAYIIFLVKADRFSKMLQLQNLELEILRVKRAVEKLQEQARALLKEKEEVQVKRQAIRKRIEGIKEEIKKHLAGIEECSQRVKKAEESLSLAKKAQEYKALLREKAKNEDCVIKLRSSLKKLEEELKSLEKAQEEKGLIKKLEEIEEELSELGYSQSRMYKRLEELERSFELMKESTEDDVWQEYLKLKGKYGLPVIIPVDTFGTCGHCGTKLPSALYSRLVSGEVVPCPSCGRLVYYEGA